MQDCSDVMQLLLKTQTEMQDMPEDDPQVCYYRNVYILLLLLVNECTCCCCLLFLQLGRIACNAERCISHGNSVRRSVTLVPIHSNEDRIMQSSL